MSYHYDYTGTTSSSGASSEKVADQARAIEDVQLTVEKLRITVSAMWDLMQEQGITKPQLYAKIDDVIKKDLEDPYSLDFRICPKCNRKITEQSKTPFRGTCLFCGTQMMFYPFDEESREAAKAVEASVNNPAPAPAAESEAYDPLQDLGF